MRNHVHLKLSIVSALVLACALTNVAWAAATINVGGTTNLNPLVAKAAASYQDAHPGTAVSVKGSSSGAGIAALKDHQIDVAMSDVAVHDADFVDSVLGVVGFAFVVNPDTGIKNLTRGELQDLYSGKITNWREIGGNDLKVVLIGREIGTGTRFVFEDKVAKTETTIQVEPTAVAVADTVAKTSGSVGYIASGFIGKHQDLVVTYEGIEPTPENIRNHTYSFSTDEHLYTRRDASADVTAFVEYVKNDKDLLIANGVF